MKIKVSNAITSLVAVTLLTTVAFTGAGLVVSIHKAEAAVEQTAQSAPEAMPSDDQIKDGAAKLLQTAKELREAAIAGDEVKLKAYGPELEENWSKIEDGIKPQYPKFYEQVEKYLNPAVAGTQASAIDKDAILQLDDQLIQVLNDLVEVGQIKAGATELLAVTTDMKNAIKSGDEAKIKEVGPKLEEVWSTFEDSVKPRYAGIYQEIEKNLNPEVAGVQKTPMDTKKLTQLNDSLAKVLTTLLQNQK